MPTISTMRRASLIASVEPLAQIPRAPAPQLCRRPESRERPQAVGQQPVLVTVPLGHVVAFQVTPEKSVK